MEIVALGGTCCAAAAIPAGATSQENHLIPRLGALPPHIFLWNRRNHSANLHPLGGVARMIQLVHHTCGQANLVAVRGITRRRRGHQLPLRQLPGQGLRHRRQGVRCASDPHGPIYIGPAGQGIPDGAANTGGRAAERLNLRGMVVGFVLEEQEPGLLFPIHRNGHVNGAGIDLLALVQLGEKTLLMQILGRQGPNVHEIHRFGAAQLPSGSQVVFIGLLQQGIGELHRIDGGEEGGVAAVIGPVGVDHANFRDGGAAALLAEIGLAEGNVVQIHGQPQGLHKIPETLPVQV